MLNCRVHLVLSINVVVVVIAMIAAAVGKNLCKFYNVNRLATSALFASLTTNQLYRSP